MRRKEMREWISRWQEELPTLYPVVLKISSKFDRDEWGETGVETVKGRKVIVVTIRKDLDPVGRFMVLVHEYAHAMQLRPGAQEDADTDHSGEWGLCVSKVWQHIQGE